MPLLQGGGPPKVFRFSGSRLEGLEFMELGFRAFGEGTRWVPLRKEA